MSSEFSASQTCVNSTQLERLINRPSGVVADLASRVGWNGLSGLPANLDVGGAISVLILSIATQHSVEPQAMRPWLPRLRTGTLVRLGCDLSNWSYRGLAEREMAFNSQFYGGAAKVRAEAARLLGVNLFDAASLLRYHSSSDVECLADEQMEFLDDGRAPRFVIYASILALRIKEVCPGPLFISRPKAAVGHEYLHR